MDRQPAESLGPLGDELLAAHPGNGAHCAMRSMQFRRFLEAKGLEWLFLFWLDCEFYKTIRKTKVKQENAKRVYAKWVVPFRNTLPKDVVSDIELKVKAAVIDDQIFITATPMLEKNLLTEWRRFKKTIVQRQSRRQLRVDTMRARSADNLFALDTPTSAETSEAFDYIARKMFNAQTGVRLQDRKVMLRTVSFSFTGSEGIDWILRNVFVASDRLKGAELGNYIMQHAGGTFEQIGSASKRIGILKDDNTLYRPLKIYQDQVIEVSQDEFAKQLEISTDEEEPMVASASQQDEMGDIGDSGNAVPPAPGSPEEVTPRSPRFELPIDGSSVTPDHSASTTPRSGRNSNVNSRSPSQRSLPRNTISNGYISQGEGVVTLEIGIDDAEKRAKRKRAASVGQIIRPMIAHPVDSDKKPYDLLEEAILDNDMYLLMTVADIGLPKREMEKFARAVVYIHSEKGVDLLPLLNYLLSDEVRTHVEQMLLFRSNNFNTYALSAFAKLIGQSWLRKIFHPILETLHTHDEIQFDEDGYLMASSERPFCALLEEVVDRICSSVSECPSQLRLICRNVKEMLPAKNKPEVFFHVASFLFLRVICPALLSPDEYGLFSAQVNQHRQRILIQLSKVIQSYCAQRAEKPVVVEDHEQPLSDSEDRAIVDPIINTSTRNDRQPETFTLLHAMAGPNKSALDSFVQRLISIGHLRKVKPYKLEHSSKEVHFRALQTIHSLVQSRAKELMERTNYKNPERVPELSYLLEQLAAEPLPEPELKRSSSASSTKAKKNTTTNVLRL